MPSGSWTRILNLLSAALLWIAYFGDGTAGQFDANFTLQNVWGRLQSDSRSIIQCLSDTNYKKIKFSRKLDTGQGARLPKLSQQFMQAKPVFARILFMPGEDKLNRFGAFQCKIVTGGVSTEIITLKLPPSTEAELDALDPYQVASVGDTVELEVNVSKKLELPVKWRHNGVDVPDWDGELRVEIEDAQLKDAGVYETYYEGRRSEGVHALTRLIIRSCPVDMYGKDCDQECPPCYNGGICHDTWGVCVCPAGFTGPNCEIACGGNHFGAECSKFCSPPQNNSNTDELCASHLFCKPDPYGCSCAPGFKGSSCMEHCEPGWYGADCKQPCHCAYGISSCNRITGACSGGCAKGWRGLSCQIDDPNATNTVETTTMVYCPLGMYGPSCERECHCAGNEHCHVVTGLCPSGCEEGWGGHSCGTCRPGRFGDNCEFICHCEGGHHNCDKDGFCHGGCEAGWAGFTCQTECTPGRFGTNCASTCHCHENSTAPCDKITGVCEGDCEAGYMGEDCQTLCPQNKWGINCVNECICLNGGQCNRNDGSCACEGRWKGLTCNESEPQIIAAADQEVNAGQQVFISCTADAVPEPVMQISPSSGEDDDLKVVVRTLEQNQYQAVIKVKPKDPGQLEFHCSARNPHGYDMKKMIITVIEPPKLTTPPWLLSKTNLSLTVGWRDWEFGKDIGGSATDRIEYMVKYRQTEESTWERVDGWSTEVTNTINDLTPNTQYEVAVKCRRLGKGGEGGVSPGLFVKTECGVPTMDGLAREVLPAFISENSVTLTWKKPYEGPLRCTLEGYYLTYHPEADESILQAIDLDGDADTAQLEDLTPNTAYVIRLYAVTAVEKSKYFVELTLRTAETIPDPVTHLECKAVEEPAGLLLVSWEAPSDVNGAIKGYIVNYTLTDRGHCGFLSDEDTGTRQALSEDTEITLSNLHPYSVYNVSVQARTSAGEGDAVSVSAATAEADPDEPPLNVRVISSTSTSLEYRWDPVPCEHANGIISHYVYMMAIPTDIYPLHLKLRKRSLDVPFPNASLHVVEGLQVEIKNLQPYTEYGFMVSGVNRAGIGVFSEILFHKTEEDIPGKPQYLVVNTVSAHEIGLCWSEPEVSNGQIRQYHIQLWDHEMSTVAADLVYNVTTNEDDQRLTTVVENLTSATNFFIKIRAGTKAGWGDFCDPVSGRTLDGIPGEPAEVSVLDNGLRFLNVTWQEPSKKNGAVLAYKIKYRPVLTLDPVFNATPFAEKETEVEDSSATEMTLVDLHPSTEYEISVAAKTSAGYGPQARVMAWTVILGDHVSPSLRTLDVKVTNETIPIAFSTTGSTSVYKYQVIVEDSRNKEPIDESQLSDYDTAVVQKGLPYYIAAELDPRNVTKEGEQSFVVGDRKVWGGYKNVHLNPGHEYKIRIRTLVFKDDEIKSVLSDPEKETAGSFYVEINENDDPKIAGFDLLPFILILLALLVFVIAVTFLTSYAVCMSRRRKKKSSSLSTNEFGRSESLTFSVMYKGPDSEMVGGPIVNDGYRTLPITEKPASLKHSRSDSKIARGIRIESLQEYLLNALATNQLAEEFQKLVEGQISPWTIARKSMNVKKNRYGNILPYDRYRVVLQTTGKNDSDYINASYIDGYRRSLEYIITQGPLCNTVDDFWRMVWQENAPVIVMLTELMENGKKKCTKYWPDDSMMSGDIQILLIHSEECTDYVVRTILMRKLDEVSTHRVQQYQFTAWPDRTIPLNTNYFIKFLKRIREDHPVMGGPIVVHCSAGAGRSGTYVAIDALYQQAAEEKRVEVFRFVNNARHQRTRLVQTLEQYTFIYEALIEAFQFEDTTIPLDKIGTYLKELNHMSTLDNRALIRKQYHKLNRTQKKVETSRCSVALSESNIFRNRDPLIVPLDAARVSLKSLDLPDEPSDYINAVYVNGYRKKNAFVATQMPLTHTIEDFWRMIYKLKSSLIVMLNDADESKELDVGIYWPELGDCRYGDFDVQVITCEEQGDFTTRVMMMSHCEKKNEDPLKVIQLQYNGWSSELKPASMLKLLDTAEMAYEVSSGGPITVHCMDGATRTGLFIAAKNVCDQIRADSALDVYQIVKSIRTNRPDFIPNSDQYRFLFEIAQELISE